jgi:peroxiredoxin (alkyl hydroperoxide reductase subunit C)
MEQKNEMTCYDWFFCTKKLDKDKLLGELLKSRAKIAENLN